MGAIASGGVRVLNEDVVSWYRVSEADIDHVARAEQAELERRERVYRDGSAPVTTVRRESSLPSLSARRPDGLAPLVDAIGSARLVLIGEASHGTHDPGTSHLFEEPGTQEQVATLASGWCRRHLTAPVA
jgi:hypothetical protein